MSEIQNKKSFDSLKVADSEREKELASVRRLLAAAKGILAQVDEAFTKQDEGPRQYPTFDASEIVQGPLLGVGGFGVVFEIVKFNLKVPEKVLPKEGVPGEVVPGEVVPEVATAASAVSADNSTTDTKRLEDNQPIETETAAKPQDTEGGASNARQDEGVECSIHGSPFKALPQLELGNFHPADSVHDGSACLDTDFSRSGPKSWSSHEDSKQNGEQHAPLPSHNESPSGNSTQSSVISGVQTNDGLSEDPTDTDTDLSAGHKKKVTVNTSDNDKDNDNVTTGTIPHDDSHYEVQNARDFMAKNVLRNGTSRYALKRLHAELGDKDRTRGMIDLALEVKYLSVLWHPNIVKMRGYAQGPTLDPNFFIILDRLFEVLDTKINMWSRIEKSCHRGWFGHVSNKQRIQELLVERLVVAYDLAAAFHYMHTKKLVYRDIKQENIGFDIRGDVKVFDFGLSKSLSPSLKVKGSDGQEVYGYRLTPRTGSLPYMAPEIAECLPYDTKCDVFSFAILLWEILALKPAFKYISRPDFLRRVVQNRERLGIQHKWPSLTRLALKEAWEHDPQKRPDMKRVASLLRGDLNELSTDPAVIRRTVHMRDRSSRSWRLTRGLSHDESLEA